MLTFQIPKIIRKIDLGEYAEELSGNELLVWVNPPRDKLNELQELLDDQSGDEMIAWCAEIWDEEPETVKAFIEDTMDTDPALWSFMVTRTFDLISEHRRGQQKN